MELSTETRELDVETQQAIADFLERSDLAPRSGKPSMRPLPGGVSSDIWLVDLDSKKICVKRALPRLKVDRLWEAPVSRNRYEAAWLRQAAVCVPGSAPDVLAVDEERGLFAMAYLDPDTHPVWKEQLRGGAADAGFAAQVGARLAAIHGATADRADIAVQFATDDIFHAMRPEPYLLATAVRQPDMAERLEALCARTETTKKCLVHGDVSPKNILAGPDGPVFIDAECAWYGDPAFDLAFCLNHMLLKCLWVPRAAAGFMACFDALSETYLNAAAWEDRQILDARTAHLLPGLFLGRVDGKSPAEYIVEDRDRDVIRGFAKRFLVEPADTLTILARAWRGERGL